MNGYAPPLNYFLPWFHIWLPPPRPLLNEFCLVIKFISCIEIYSGEKPKPVLKPCEIVKKMGYFQKQMDNQRCTSVKQLQMNSCKGLCPSETSDDMKTQCTCCKPVNVVSKQVDMRCEDGSEHKIAHQEFQSCSCSRCSVK